jgi:restriction system protein
MREGENREGLPRLRLVKGDDLYDLLKQYLLGVKTTTRIVEEITVENDYFDQCE